MTLLTNAVPLLWLIASAGAFFLVFRPKANWPVVATPIPGAERVRPGVHRRRMPDGGDSRPDDTPPPKAKPVPVTLPDPALVRAHPERYLRLDRVAGCAGRGGRRPAGPCC
ncbi:hypothetical protein ACRAWD_13160 [Caulobacter segnis]